MKRNLKLALMVSAAAMLAPVFAQAQTYTRMITFGDSLSDNGNLYATTGNPPAPYNRRFTNQLVWTEYLSGQTSNAIGGYLTAITPTLINNGNINFAFGGARTDSAPNANGPIPGTNTQISSYLARGGTFGANDVVTLWGGANNILQITNPAAASSVVSAAAGDIGAQALQLANAGAKTILVVNLPDLGLTPSGSATATSSNQASFLFNSTLDSQLNNDATAVSGTNFIKVDINAVFRALVANPSAFGFSNVTAQCVQTLACVTGGAAVQDTYLFWDGVHPTGAGHRLVALVAAQYLYTPTLASGVTMFADQSYNLRHDAMVDMSNILDNAKGQQGFFVQVIGDSANRDVSVATQATVGGAVTTNTQKAYDYSMYGGRIGLIQSLGENSTWGVSISALSGDSQGYLVQATPNSFNIDAGINWDMDGSFVIATAGLGIDTYKDYERQTLLAPISLTKEEVKANSFSASIEYGKEMEMGGMNLTPVGRLGYINAKMESFVENGVFDNIRFEDRKVDAFTAAIELRASANLSENTKFNGSIGYEGVLSGDSEALIGKIENNTAHAFTNAAQDTANQGVLVSLGLSNKFGSGYMISAQYNGNFGDDSSQNHRAVVSLVKAF